VKKNILTISLAGFCMGMSALLFHGNLNAADSAAPALMDECSRDLLLSYFPEKFVNETFKKFNIAEDKWAAINASLASKDKDIVKLVEQKAASMNPNPLKDPQQRQAAVKLFRETLLQVFTEALKNNGIQDTSQFQGMLDDIQQQKAKKFAQCMEKQREHMLNEAMKAPNGDAKKVSDSDENEDEDEDDDDDYDDDDYDDEEGEQSKEADKLKVELKGAAK
jgi:hypothetical protein